MTQTSRRLDFSVKITGTTMAAEFLQQDLTGLPVAIIAMARETFLCVAIPGFVLRRVRLESFLPVGKGFVISPVPLQHRSEMYLSDG